MEGTDDSDEIDLRLLFLENIIWPTLAITYLIFIILAPGMLQFSSIRLAALSSIPLGVLVFAEGIALIGGQFDLSIGQITGFVAMGSAVIVVGWPNFLPPQLAIFVPIVIGLLSGCINGFLIGFLGFNPFLVTLGTFMMFGGLTLTISTNPIFQGFPAGYLSIGGTELGSVVTFIILIILLYIFLKYTQTGAKIYSVGNSEETAEMLGIRVNRIKFLIFALSGTLCGVSALLYSGYIGSVPNNLADNTVFLAFAGAVLGGISLNGGKGSIVNAMGGVFLLGVVESGLAQMAVDPWTRRIFYGVLVITAIVIAKFRDRVRDTILRRKIEGSSQEKET